MKNKLTPIATALSLIGLVNLPAFAEASPSAIDRSEQQLIKKLTSRTAALEGELKQLQQQIRELRSNNNRANVIPVRTIHHTQNTAKQTDANQVGLPATNEQRNTDNISEAEIIASQRETIQNQPPTGKAYYIGHEPLYIAGNPVVSAPFLGPRSEYNGSDLLINSPWVNLDLHLLQQRQKLNNYYKAHDIVAPDTLVDISGKAEAQVTASRPYTGNRTSDIDLSGAEFDINAMVNKWSMGFLAFSYDNSPASSGRRVENTRLFLDRGFITFGNLNSSPFYATLGQLYVPFGQYSTSMISDPLTKLVGRSKARTIQLGYSQQYANHTGLNAALFTFRGDSQTTSTTRINTIGANVDYSFNFTQWNGDIAASYISNMGDAGGMQKNGASTGFTGFSGNQALDHRVPGVDVRGSLGVGPLTFLTEYVTSTRDFALSNLSFNGRGAKPQALHIEGIYNFPMWGKPSLIALGYDQTKDALALLLPKQRYIAAFSTSFWKDTIESLEFRHDINYGAGNSAAGQNQAVIPNGLGHSSDNAILQVGVYF